MDFLFSIYVAIYFPSVYPIELDIFIGYTLFYTFFKNFIAFLRTWYFSITFECNKVDCMLVLKNIIGFLKTSKILPKQPLFHRQTMSSLKSYVYLPDNPIRIFYIYLIKNSKKTSLLYRSTQPNTLLFHSCNVLIAFTTITNFFIRLLNFYQKSVFLKKSS